LPFSRLFGPLAAAAGRSSSPSSLSSWRCRLPRRPALPSDRATALRVAFTTMCSDPAFVKEAEALGFDLSPIDGTEVTKLIARSAATPKPVIDRYNTLVAPRRN
jgi:hypothetical protein